MTAGAFGKAAIKYDQSVLVSTKSFFEGSLCLIVKALQLQVWGIRN